MSKIHPKIDAVLNRMIRRNPEMEDPKNKITVLAGDITVVFMQGVQVGEEIAREEYMMDPTIKPVDFLQQERE